MKILIINGPNLNMLGYREKAIYGERSYNELENYIYDYSSKVNVITDIRQSNSEGQIIDMIQDACFDLYDGLIINAGAYTHYSYAIRDALAILHIPVIEVHLSDIDQRETFRRISVIREVCTDTVKGLGFDSYTRAIDRIIEINSSVK